MVTHIILSSLVKSFLSKYTQHLSFNIHGQNDGDHALFTSNTLSIQKEKQQRNRNNLHLQILFNLPFDNPTEEKICLF